MSSFLEKKFRLSKSYFTKTAYKVTLKRFEKFLKTKYDLDVDNLIGKIKEKELNTLKVLGNYYICMMTLKKSDDYSYQNAAIVNYVITAKEFLNGEDCKIYKADIRQKFRLPR